jgi:hypothetical protein
MIITQMIKKSTKSQLTKNKIISKNKMKNYLKIVQAMLDQIRMKKNR